MDTNKCKEQVYCSSSWTNHQCSRNIWEDGYCKQHHPESVKKRRDENSRKWEEKMDNSPRRKLAKAQERIKKLEAALQYFANFACSPKGDCECNNCVARDLLNQNKS